MANKKKYFTDESLATLVDETKQYVDNAVLDKLSIEIERGVSIENNFINQIPISTDVSGNIYNGTGFKTGTRWSNSGKAETSATGHCITGYIPAKYNDVLRIKNVTIECTYPYIVYFDSNKEVLGVITITPNGDLSGVHTYVLNSRSNVAYIRLVLGEINANSIVTINDNMLSGAIKLGWLVDGEGEKVAPNVFSTQILNEDGTLYAEKVDEKIDDVKVYVDTAIAANNDYKLIFNIVEGNNSYTYLSINENGEETIYDLHFATGRWGDVAVDSSNNAFSKRDYYFQWKESRSPYFSIKEKLMLDNCNYEFILLDEESGIFGKSKNFNIMNTGNYLGIYIDFGTSRVRLSDQLYGDGPTEPN